ncbi:MAG: hypothetical protein MJZ33_02500 [Paludibacteraceae bacterium]|nr:hypothetical protein [Paludibacteraceae bacterium]
MGRKSKFDSAFKTKVVLDTLKGKETLSELAKGIAYKSVWMAYFYDYVLESENFASEINGLTLVSQANKSVINYDRT